MSIVINESGAYQPPPGGVPAPSSAQPGTYDYSGITRVTDGGQIVTPQDALDRLNMRCALTAGQVMPVANSLPARLHIVIPDHDRLRLLALQRGIQNGATEFNAEIRRLELHEVADAVVRSEAFAVADIEVVLV